MPDGVIHINFHYKYTGVGLFNDTLFDYGFLPSSVSLKSDLLADMPVDYLLNLNQGIFIGQIYHPSTYLIMIVAHLAVIVKLNIIYPSIRLVKHNLSNIFCPGAYKYA